MKKSVCFVLILMLLVTLFAGCSKSASNDSYSMNSGGSAMIAPMPAANYAKDEAVEYNYEYEPAYDYETEGYYSEGSSDSALFQLAADAGRKLIWHGTLELESLEYEQSEEALFSLVQECGGYIESSNRSGGNVDRYSGVRSMRSGSFTVRVPAEKFQYFISAAGSVATVLSSSTGSDDVTDSYFDTEARLTVLKVKEERLLDMLEKGDDLEYLIEIERELADTRYEIESLTGTLRRYDGLISYATIYVTLREVTKPTEVQEPDPVSTWDRIKARFMASLKDIGDGIVECVIFIIGYSPILLVLALVIVVIIFLVRIPGRRRRKKAAKAAEAAEAQTPAETGESPRV